MRFDTKYVLSRPHWLTSHCYSEQPAGPPGGGELLVCFFFMRKRKLRKSSVKVIDSGFWLPPPPYASTLKRAGRAGKTYCEQDKGTSSQMRTGGASPAPPHPYRAADTGTSRLEDRLHSGASSWRPGAGGRPSCGGSPGRRENEVREMKNLGLQPWCCQARWRAGRG